jgi:hypothetical protein
MHSFARDMKREHARKVSSACYVSSSKQAPSLKPQKEFQLRFVWKVSTEAVEKPTFDLRPLPEEKGENGMKIEF